MNTGVALDIEFDLKQGCAKPLYKMYPEDESCSESELYDVHTDGSCILLNGKRYKPFDLEDKEDVKKLLGVWIVDECRYGYMADCLMITAIQDDCVYTSCDSAICETPGHFRPDIWSVELLVDFVFMDTGLPVGKEVKE